MPLVRFEVKNEYGLAKPELYRDVNKEDPKAILDGVAVAGLVGILRQLGDLAEFAAEVFHGLQEQVMTTSSRSRRLVVRLQDIESALQPLEKAVLAQTSHIHFAYTAGTEWHPHIRSEQNHFIYNELPRFITDSYEECRDPPRLHLLDKFDTGGPGSCLRRYSDPTFFRRVSSATIEANSTKVQRDKKAAKIKKRRSLQRNGDISRSASLYGHSSRMQYASPVANPRSSFSGSASNIDTSMKSEIEHHSNSFDSKNGSGYIECVFHAPSSTQSEEQEPREFSSKFIQHDDAVDLVIHRIHTSDEMTGVVDDNYPQNSYMEPLASRSSCVSWDEKAEILEPQGQCYDRHEDPEILVIDSELHLHGMGAPIFGNDVQTDDQFDDNYTATQLSSSNQFDEVESEPDTFVDALNTIDSESEIDLDCKKKQEQTNSSTVSNEVINDWVLNCEPWSIPAITLKEHPSECKSLSASAIASKEHLSDIESISVPVSSTEEPSSSKTISNSLESEELHSQSSDVSSIKFWTNGGLLGLEPSKPPDFLVSKSISRDFVIGGKYETVNSHVTSLPAGFEQMVKKGSLGNGQQIIEKVTSSDSSESYNVEQEIGKNLAFPVANLEATVQKFGDSHFSDKQSHSDPKAIYTEANQNNENPIGMLYKKLELVNQHKTCISDQRRGNNIDNHQTVADTMSKQNLGRRSPLDSLTSSPPLEHMQISFRPANTFETAKLELKFPEASPIQGSIRDMFPSFQLVPEPTIVVHNAGFDSDDDAFPGSSPCLSYDYPGYHSHSESDSEQWGSGGTQTPQANDPEIYDALGRISPVESVSSFLQLKEMANNGSESSSLEIPGFDDVGQIFLGESKSPLESTPQPPSLPPVQWWIVKQQSNTKEENLNVVFESREHESDQKPFGSVISSQLKAALVNDRKISKENVGLNPKIMLQDPEKLNNPLVANQTANGIRVDEKDDFLQQIRTKAFNLRRTLPPRETVPSNATTNGKVAAILEKANAIRQAVGSESGEDDNWSDT